MRNENDNTESTCTGWKAFDKADQKFQEWLDWINDQTNPLRDGGPKGPLCRYIATIRYQIIRWHVKATTGIDIITLGFLPPDFRVKQERALIAHRKEYAAADARARRRREGRNFNPFIFAGCGFFAFVAFYFTVFAYGLEHPEMKPIDTKPAVGTRDTDWPSKPRTKIVRTSDESFTITFTQCRENEKEHVSCLMETPDGDSHWVYLPGIHLKASPK